MPNSFKKISLLFLVFNLIFPAPSLFAETIVLKSGEKLQANIIERNNNTLKIDYRGTPVIFYDFEIDNINGKPFVVEAKKEKGNDNIKEGEVVNIKTITPDGYVQRGMVFNNKGDFDLAISDFNKAIQIDKDSTSGYASRGLAYANKKDYDQAIKDYSKAISLKENFEEAYFMRGLSFVQKGNIDAAYADFEKAVDINPKFIQPYMNLASINIAKKDFVSAISLMDKVIQINPDVPTTYFLRGVGYANKGNLDEALSNYTKALALNSSYAEAYVNRALAYAFKSKYEETKDDPNSPKSFVNIGITKVNKADLDKAIADCDKAIEINPKYSDAYVTRLRIRMLRQEYDAAWLDVKKIEELGLKIDPQLIKDLESLSSKNKVK